MSPQAMVSPAAGTGSMFGSPPTGGRPTRADSTAGCLTNTHMAGSKPALILHDTHAKEVPAIGTPITTSCGWRDPGRFGLPPVGSIVDKENLAADYNVYVFTGLTGRSADRRKEALRAKKCCYANRAGSASPGSCNEADETARSKRISEFATAEKAVPVRLTMKEDAMSNG
ncbi:MAG: hypothetical protein U5R30_10350 [Deltaproteobacteria bacterium]|nr:hypothetical protein [Deltaproteobacteria bacterium]